MKLLRASAVLLAVTAAAVAAMRVTSAVDAANEPTQSSGTGRQAAAPQDHRAGLFALQTGRLTFGQLWFAANR